MKSKQSGLFLVLAIVAGFAGGFISNQIVANKSAFAENEQKSRKVIVAEEFRLVDENGIPRAKLGFDSTFQKTELLLSSPKDDPLGTPLILLSIGTSGGFLRIDGGRSREIFAYRAVLSAYEGQAKMSMGRVVIPQGNIELSTSDLATDIVLRDYYYNKRAVIGNMELMSEKTWIEQKNPLFSVVLLNEKGDVLWSAP